MSFAKIRCLIAPAALAALALGMTACSSDEPESTPTVTVTAQTPETSTPQPSMKASEPADETTAPMASEEPSEDPVTPNDESGVLDVTVAGDQGIQALQVSGSVPEGTAGPANPKLITGPGGCFAIVNEGPPQLVVFPEDATFVLVEGKPSATFSGTEHFVGRQMDVSSISIPTTAVAGIPERCLEGSADSVIVVS